MIEKPLKSVMVSYVACMDCENDKIQLTNYSTFHTSCVQTVSVEGLMKGGKRDLDDEQNVTEVKKRETNEERQTRFVNLCRRLHISVMAPHVDRQNKINGLFRFCASFVRHMYGLWVWRGR